MNAVLVGSQVSLIHVLSLPHHSVSTHQEHPSRRFCTLPLSPADFRFHFRFRGLDFAIRSQARRCLPAVSSSLVYGLVLHLQLLPTPPRGDAVSFGFRPESVCL